MTASETGTPSGHHEVVALWARFGGVFCASRESGVNSGTGAAASRRVGVGGDRLRDGHAVNRTRRWSVLDYYYWVSPYTSPRGINRRQIGIWTALTKLDFGERSSMGVDGGDDLLWCGCGRVAGDVATACARRGFRDKFGLARAHARGFGAKPRWAPSRGPAGRPSCRVRGRAGLQPTSPQGAVSR